MTTHLLHHIPEGFSDFGPLYDRWLYPLERANSWITRQILQHGHEESTVMQTYRVSTIIVAVLPKQDPVLHFSNKTHFVFQLLHTKNFRDETSINICKKILLIVVTIQHWNIVIKFKELSPIARAAFL